MQRGWLLLTIYLKKQRLAPAAFENPGLAPPQGTLAEPWLTLQESSPAGPGRGGGRYLLLSQLGRRGDLRRERGGGGSNGSPRSFHPGGAQASAEWAEPSQAFPPSHSPRLALSSPQGSHTLALTTRLYFSSSSILQA